jgi:hypothetical protein
LVLAQAVAVAVAVAVAAARVHQARMLQARIRQPMMHHAKMHQARVHHSKAPAWAVATATALGHDGKIKGGKVKDGVGDERRSDRAAEEAHSQATAESRRPNIVMQCVMQN